MNIESVSQARQDEFVLRVLDGKRNGTFVDIGAGDPYQISNTVLMQKEYGWTGILCDIAHRDDLIRERGGTVFGDAFQVDWGRALDAVAKDGRIDYLSLDLEPPILTMAALLALPLDRHRFNVITIEHDLYRGNKLIRLAMRGVLSGMGYHLAVGDVCVDSGAGPVPFEDWWIDPIVVSPDKASASIREMIVLHHS